MSKLFSTLTFLCFLVFQTSSLAEENSTSPQTNVEEPEAQEGSEEQTEEEPKETLSEAEKEARDAEAEELREAGVDEPIPVN